jgi:hypothetical protein
MDGLSVCSVCARTWLCVVHVIWLGVLTSLVVQFLFIVMTWLEFADLRACVCPLICLCVRPSVCRLSVCLLQAMHFARLREEALKSGRRTVGDDEPHMEALARKRAKDSYGRGINMSRKKAEQLKNARLTARLTCAGVFVAMAVVVVVVVVVLVVVLVVGVVVVVVVVVVVWCGCMLDGCCWECERHWLGLAVAVLLLIVAMLWLVASRPPSAFAMAVVALLVPCHIGPSLALVQTQ